MTEKDADKKRPFTNDQKSRNENELKRKGDAERK